MQSRWVRFIGVDERLRCPCGHALDRLAIWTTDNLICDKKNSDGRSACGRILLLIGSAWRIRGKVMFIYCEVSGKELHEMEARKMDVDAMLEFLDLKLPPSKEAA